MRVLNHVALCLAAILPLALASFAWGEEPAAGPKSTGDAQTAQATANQLTSENIINMIRHPCSELLQEFSTPAAADVMRGSDKHKEDDDTVLLRYGAVSVYVRHKEVAGCYFDDRWTEPVCGVRIGDKREQVLKVLGKPTETNMLGQSESAARDVFMPEDQDVKLKVLYVGLTNTVGRIEASAD